jgi:hypothetical protein
VSHAQQKDPLVGTRGGGRSNRSPFRLSGGARLVVIAVLIAIEVPQDALAFAVGAAMVLFFVALLLTRRIEGG